MRSIGFLSLLFVAACTAKLSGSIQVDGSDFKVAECRNGRAVGFYGVQFADGSGRKLRLVANPDGTSTAMLFQKGAAQADTVGTCGTLTVNTQNSRINGVTNIEGEAKLACEGAGHKIAGDLKYKNCH